MSGLLPILFRVQRETEVALPTRKIHDQGDVNCCFSCAIASAMEARDREMPELAPLFHFHFAGGASAIVQGLTIDEARLALIQNGVCTHAHHRFPISRPNVSKRASQAAIDDGFDRRPLDRSAGGLLWKVLATGAPELIWKRHLLAGAPIVIGITPNQDYQDLTETRPKLRTNQGPFGSMRHAAVVIGFRDEESSFIVQDSKDGDRFAAGGQWFLPYNLCSSPFIVLAVALASAD